jgi:uncharacterized protein (DUF1330 family)
MRLILAALSCVLAACASAPLAGTEPAPAAPTCIMVVQGVVTDREAFPQYARALPPLYTQFGGTYLVVARDPETLEGDPPFESIVISRWPSCEAARAFWNSAEYRALVAMRADWGRFDVIIAPEMPANTTAAPMARRTP